MQNKSADYPHVLLTFYCYFLLPVECLIFYLIDSCALTEIGLKVI